MAQFYTYKEVNFKNIFGSALGMLLGYLIAVAVPAFQSIGWVGSVLLLALLFLSSIPEYLLYKVLTASKRPLIHRVFGVRLKTPTRKFASPVLVWGSFAIGFLVPTIAKYTSTEGI
jgi:hypothetical protein